MTRHATNADAGIDKREFTSARIPPFSFDATAATERIKETRIRNPETAHPNNGMTDVMTAIVLQVLAFCDLVFIGFIVRGFLWF